MRQLNANAVFDSIKKQPRGFTLIDLMIAVAILGILVAIAIPSYQNYLIKSRRAAAEAHLMDIAQQQQQYVIDARNYAGSLAALNITTPSNVATYYTIAIVANAGPPPGFKISATPIPGTPQASDSVLSIDNTGAKIPANLW